MIATRVKGTMQQKAAIEAEIEVLCKKRDALNNKISKLVDQQTKINSQENVAFIKTISSDLSKITSKQWQWILAGPAGMERLDFCRALYEKLGFSYMGYWQESMQVNLTIQKYGFAPDKVKAGFKILKKHLKVMTIKSHQSTETGIRFTVCSLTDNANSALYVHRKGDVVLYKDRYSDAMKFRNFAAFVDWYVTVTQGGDI